MPLTGGPSDNFTLLVAITQVKLSSFAAQLAENQKKIFVNMLSFLCKHNLDKSAEVVKNFLASKCRGQKHGSKEFNKLNFKLKLEPKIYKI